MSSTALAFVFDDDSDDFVGNTQAMPTRQPLQAAARRAGDFDKDELFESAEPLENNVVFLRQERPSTSCCQRLALTAAPTIDIDDQSDIINNEEADDQDEIVLTSSGCSLKPRHRSASEKVTGPLEITLTDTASKLKARSGDAMAFGKAKAPSADMAVSTETPGCDLEESLYFTIGGMIIPSFFAEATGHTVKTHTVSYDLMPSGWDTSIDEISAAFETSSALLAYLASHSDEAIKAEALKSMSAKQSAFFSQEIETARAKGYSFFTHSGSLDGLFSVAVPVYVDDQVIGAVGIFVPRALTCSDNLEKHLLPQLRLMADAVAQSSVVAPSFAAKATTETETSMAMAA